jgi:hypothetical protein
MPSYARLKGIRDIKEVTLCEQLETNMIEFFSWGLLCIGAFGNVRLGLGTQTGRDMSTLRPVKDQYYQDGQVWEGFRQDWVWESGVDYPVQPIQVSGVYINNIFYPTASTTGTYAHHVDYPRGRVVFNQPLFYQNTAVQAEYSYRLYSFQSADQPWFRQVMFQSFRIDDSQFLQFGSGVWNALIESKVQLPVVVVEVVPRRQMFGYEHGGTIEIHQDILYHIFSETPYDRKVMMDIITYQKEKTIPLFDKNMMVSQSAWPLAWDGSIAPGAKSFPDLVKPTGDGGFYWRGGTFLQMGTQETISTPPLYQAVVRSTFWVNLLMV